MNENWTSYLCQLNGAAASVFVDLGLRASAPDPERLVLVLVALRMNAPRPDGLSSDAESQTLFAVEDALATALATTADARFAGRVTTGGVRQFFFYARRGDGAADAVRRAVGGFPGYAATADSRPDVAWRAYLDFLLPSSEGEEQQAASFNAAQDPDVRLRANSAQLIARLRSHGDALTAARPVTYYAYFPSAASRGEFVRRAAALHFAPRDVTPARTAAAAAGPPPYGVVLERTHAVDAATVEAVELPLAALARALGGEYDGWETVVTRGPAA